VSKPRGQARRSNRDSRPQLHLDGPGIAAPIPVASRAALTPGATRGTAERERGGHSGANLATISACILARNEAHRIEDALRSLQGWTDEIFVIDNESDDDTARVARRYTEKILTAPRAANFDAARNLVLDHALGDWIFYLDADERVPPRLGPALREKIAREGDTFEALLIPFKHYFCGAWIRHSGWWPGYTRPQLVKRGRFRYNERLHSGLQVDGRTEVFPADDPDLAIIHYSYDDLHHYLEKLNRYTDGEAESLLKDGASHSWQAMLAHLVHDWQAYYERGRGDLDGMHGFVLALMAGIYRFTSRAKLWDERRKRGDLNGSDPVPADLREVLEFMAHVAQTGAERWLVADQRPATGDPLDPSRTAHSAPRTLPLLWHAPMLDPSGYADEARNFVLGLLDAGEEIALAPMQWGSEEAGLAPEVLAQIQEHTVALGAPTERFVSHTLPALQQPSPHARFNIARTMFETDRLPPGWEERLNRMDRIWVPSAFNRETFVRSGVDPAKIAVIPGAIDPAPFTAEVEPWPVPGDERFRFLTLFDWTLHKGWDVLLSAFAAEFGDDPEVGLIVKTWSSNHYTPSDIRAQADAHLRATLGKSLAELPNLHLWFERLPVDAMPRLYRAVDAFVLPTRGEGWCRPLMEAMASGLPTIATAWSGLTAFHNARVGYPLPYQLLPVTAAGAEEIPIYAGHCWAEPDEAELRRLMRRIVSHPEEARRKGQAAQKSITRHYSRPAVTALVQEELARCRDLMATRPIVLPVPATALAANGRAAQELAATSAPSSRVASAGVQTNRRGPSFHAASGRRPPAPASTRNPRAVPPAKLPANPIVRDPAAPIDFREKLGRPLRVRWEGDQSLLSSLALVNREFCLGLLAASDVELSVSEETTPWHRLTADHDPRFGGLFARRSALLSGPPDVIVRHHFPPNWAKPPGHLGAGGSKLILIQPWEYGHLPRDWVQAAREQVDEVWAYSRFVRDTYVRSGVPAEKVRVVPLGVDPTRFAPDGPVYPVPTEKSVRFLFVGGALERKGADLLLAAYQQAFTRADDVCLVVKDMGTRTFYYGQTKGDTFRDAVGRAEGPEIVYLDDDLTDATLAALYRACTCVVLPYRGEGFGLTPLEGMACGLPAIVTAGGATEDYLDDGIALRVPSRRRSAETRIIGPWECVADPWQLEPDLDALVDALRWVYDHPEETRKRGRDARARVESGWSWESSVADARERLLAVVVPPASVTIAPARPWEGDGSSASLQSWGTRGERHKAGKEATREGNHPAELSLCMIVRDEEPRIAQCLQSVAAYVDEMVVVDTGSKDRTREVARRCGARVFDFPWCDDFAKARNQSLDQAQGQWVFWMDADDVMPSHCGEELRRLLHRYPRRDVAFQMQVRIPPGPGEFSENIVDHVKLFPNRPDLRFEHRIHEQILPSIRRAGLEVLFSDLYVTHANYDRSERGQAKKRERDFRLLELDLRDRPEHPFVLFNLGMTYLYATKEHEVAAHYLRRSLDVSHWRDSIVRKAYAMLAMARMAQGEWDLALAANEEGRQYYPDDAELLYQAGQIYNQLDRFTEAREALERLLTGAEDIHYRSVDVGLRSFKGRHQLALLFRRLGDAPHAEQVLREVVASQPSYLPARVDLVETLQQMGRRAEAGAALSQIPEDEAIREDLERLGARMTARRYSPVIPGLGRPENGPTSAKGTQPGAHNPYPRPNWDQAPLWGRRQQTILRALQRLHALCPGPVCIVETGTIRDASDRARDSDGWSTLAWAWYAAQTGGRVVTVDIEPENLEICRGVTAPYSAVIEYVTSDSIRFLQEWRREERGEIHLLYLDSLDYFEHQQEASEEHHRAEAEAALRALAPQCLVLLDDTRPTGLWRDGEVPQFTGKGARAIPLFIEHGFMLEWAESDQALLSRGAGTGTVIERPHVRHHHEPRDQQSALATDP
jgi:glycosyltransferase involved in cell wall biosynthesis